jgi:hypothetical protein
MNSASTLHSKGMSSMASMDSMLSSEPFGKSPRVVRRHLPVEEVPEGPSTYICLCLLLQAFIHFTN